MDDVTKIITAIFGLVAVIAIVSVVVSRKSQAPQAIHAIGSAIGNIVAAAVNPVSANYGYGSGAQVATAPANGVLGDITAGFGSANSIIGAVPSIFSGAK
jgi:hypothetical protein